MIEFLKKVVEKLSRINRIFPKSWRDWYYGLRPLFRYPINWFVLHGGIAAIIVVLCALPGVLWAGQPTQRIGAIVGYILGVGFYILKETLAWKIGGKKWPSLDQVGDAVGPILVALLPLWILYN
jgi:hypothetical protein